MIEWWNGLETAVQILYCIAIPASLIMLIQAILLIIGFGGGGAGIDVSDTTGIDFDTNGLDLADASTEVSMHDFTDGSNPADFGTMQLFTIQGIMTFLCVFSWTGIIAIHAGLHIALSLLLAFVLGFLGMFGVAKLLQATVRLQQNGSMDLKHVLGEKATVYVPIPPGGQGEGKVTVSLSERFLELNAISDCDKLIPTNTVVRVIDVRGDVLVVELYN